MQGSATESYWPLTDLFPNFTDGLRMVNNFRRQLAFSVSQNSNRPYIVGGVPTQCTKILEGIPYEPCRFSPGNA